MQKFPDDSEDFIEKRYAGDILKQFPSYGIFWSKFIGVDEKPLPVILPRIPKCPKETHEGYVKKIRYSQLFIAKVNYAIFCNLIAAEYQLKSYKMNLPIKNEEQFFKAMESIECGYVHIGNIIYFLDSLWGKIKKIFFSAPSNQYELGTYLKKNTVEKNWQSLYDEPKYIRDKIVHFGRHIFTFHNNELYLPITIPHSFIWAEAPVNDWMPAEIKLHKELV
ncbi:MAG: hypothetical protein IMZ52_09650 [Actinobacteria bacterium]|nr:hypothetical protein [Actinomycetota bacterium]MBE3128515.1 hypothetical protein [Actinomycetota bacterium]